MPCDKFTINKYGTIIIENINDLGGLKLLNNNLTILKLSKSRYIMHKESIITLKQYIKQDLERDPIYLLVGINKEGDRGLASRITDLEILNGIVREVREPISPNNLNP